MGVPTFPLKEKFLALLSRSEQHPKQSYNREKTFFRILELSGVLGPDLELDFFPNMKIN